MTALSERLRQLADEVEGSEIDDDRNATLTFRMDDELSRTTDLPIDQADDYYEGTVQASFNFR